MTLSSDGSRIDLAEPRFDDDGAAEQSSSGRGLEDAEVDAGLAPQDYLEAEPSIDKPISAQTLLSTSFMTNSPAPATTEGEANGEVEAHGEVEALLLPLAADELEEDRLLNEARADHEFENPSSSRMLALSHLSPAEVDDREITPDAHSDSEMDTEVDFKQPTSMVKKPSSVSHATHIKGESKNHQTTKMGGPHNVKLVVVKPTQERKEKAMMMSATPQKWKYDTNAMDKHPKQQDSAQLTLNMNNPNQSVRAWLQDLDKQDGVDSAWSKHAKEVAQTPKQKSHNKCATLCDRAEAFLKDPDKDGMELLSLIRWTLRCSQSPRRASTIAKCKKTLAKVVEADTAAAQPHPKNKQLSSELKDTNTGLRWYALPESSEELPFESRQKRSSRFGAADLKDAVLKGLQEEEEENAAFKHAHGLLLHSSAVPASRKDEQEAMQAHHKQVRRPSWSWLTAPLHLKVVPMLLVIFAALCVAVWLFVCCRKKRHQALNHMYEDIQSKSSSQRIMMHHVQLPNQV